MVSASTPLITCTVPERVRDVLMRVVLCLASKRLACLVLLRLVLLLLRLFGVDGLLVPLGRGLQLGRVVLYGLLPSSVFVRVAALYERP